MAHEHTERGVSAAFRLRFGATLAFILLAFIVPLLLFAPAVVPLEPTHLILRLIIIGYSAVMLSRLIARGEPDWFATIFWAFAYVWLGLAGLAQAFAGRDPFRNSVDATNDAPVAFVTLLGMIGWHAVYLTTSRRLSRSALETPGRFITPRGTIVAFWGAVLLTPVALVLLGDPLIFWSTRAEVSADFAVASGGSLATRGLISAFAHVPPVVALFALTLMFQAHKSLRYRPAWWMMTVIVIGLNLLVNGPVGNSRFWFGTVFIGWLLCWKVTRTARGYRTLLVALLLGLTVVFPYADYFRTPNATIQARAPYLFLVEKLDYDAVAQIRNAASVYESNGGTNGAQLTSGVGFAIPRDIWPSKAEHTGVIIARGMEFQFENLSAPLWAEGWIDWGPVGAVLYPALFGILAGFGDRRFRLARLRGGAQLALIAAPALAVYSLILIRGSLLGTIAQGAFLAAILLAISTRRDGTLSAGPGTHAARRLSAHQ